MNKGLLALALGAFMTTSGVASADDKPFSLSLFDPIQIAGNEHFIKFFRFNLLYGYNKTLTGCDLGAVNRLDGEIKGAQAGFF